MPVFAAIDIGSNAMRLLIASVSPSHRIETIETVREPIRLGTAVFSEGVIPEEIITRTVAAFERFHSRIQKHRVAAVRALGTSALREARNSSELRQRVKERTGIEIEVISGEEEARLVYRAVENALSLRRGVSLLIDIGGGSVELSIVYRGNIIMAESFKAGTVRLLQLFEARKRAPQLFSRMVESYAHTMRGRLRRELGRRRITCCIGTGGNFDALGELRVSILHKKASGRLKREELDKLAKLIVPLSFEERIRKYNLKPDRADVIVPALTITRAIMRHVEVGELLIPKVGLKEGIILEMAPPAHGSRGNRDRLLSFAEELGSRYSFDADHGRSVARLARSIFDQTKPLHGIQQSRSLLLELAALLHDIGEFIHTQDHHKHSMYLIAHSPFVGLTPHDRLLVAVIARYHRKSAPKVDHPEFKMLSRSDREFVRKCAAILRLADGLDSDRSGRIMKVKIRLRKGEVFVNPSPQGDKEMLRWCLERKSALFTQVFGRAVRLG